MKKSGITLISVVISVIILSMLSGSVIFDASSTIRKAKVAKFAEELELIEDRVEEYYILNGRYPITDDITYSGEQITEMNVLGYETDLKNEISKNNDSKSDFFIIDFGKIGVELKERGLQKTSDDIFVCTKDNHNVYYVRGLEANDNVFFSLISISDTKRIIEE